MRILAMWLLTALPLLAQIGGGGSIQGVVADPSGAVVPGASVVANNVATGVKTVRQTTGSGLYLLSPLVPGEYTVTVAASGFQTLYQEHVIVDALSEVGLNFTMKIGAATEQITIVDTPPQLNTVDASMGQTIRNEQYTALPLAMGNAPRDPTAFIALMPGVQGSGSNAAGGLYGGQANSQEVYVEGMPLTNSAVQGEVRNLALGVSVEAVEQFQLETAGAAVMFNGQGASNFVVKSGTNQFHGAAYEYFRNTHLDARGFFARARPAEHQNEYGVNVGGPIKKNRIFFFGSYDGFRYRTGTAPALVSIPTAGARGGDFSAFGVAIFDPQSTNCTSGPCTRTQFPGNVIPASRISSAAKFLQSSLPTPINSNLQNNYLGSLPTGFNNDNTTDKVDVNLNEKSRLFVLFSRGHRSQSNLYRGAGNSLPLPYTDTRVVDEYTATAQFKYTYVIRPTLLNEVNYSFSQLWVPITNATISGDWMNKAGVTGLPSGEAASSFPEIAWTGPNVPTGWRGTNSRGFIEALNNYSLQDNVQWIHGKHAVTLGVQIQWLQANERSNAYGSLATWNFSNTQTAGFNAGTLQTSTGNAYASYLLGAVNGANITEDSVVGTGGRYKDYAWWVQDNFKVAPRLTLNLGLRHDIWGPYKEVLDRESFFNPDGPNAAAGGRSGILQFYGNGQNSCHCSTNVNTDYRNFGPRLGLAYSLNSKTVIRAGYSIMYTHRGGTGGRGGARTGTGTLGLSASLAFTSLDQGISPAFYWDQGIPAYQKPPFFDPTYGTAFNGITPTGATMQFGDPSIGGRPPRYQNWNFGIDRAVTATLTAGVAYIGSNGHFEGGGGRSIWSDQINPSYLALGNLLQMTATPANITSANKIIPGLSLPFSTFTGTISQMLRPFPQYPGVTDLWGDVANSRYNSMQVTLRKRLSHGLTFDFNYTFSKAFDDTAGSRSAYNWKTEKAVTAISPHVVNALFLYHLPFGKDHRLGAGNAVVRSLAGGWQLSGITTFYAGVPFASLTANCNLPNAGSCYADYNPSFTGPVRINGGYGSGDLLATNAPAFLDKNAFVSPAPFTYGNTPRTNVLGLHNPNTYTESLSLRREFPIREGVKLAFQADAFNPFNWVVFAGPNINITSSSFGKITATSSSPRVVQFNARIMF